MYVKAREEKSKDRKYQTWANMYPYFNEERFISFEDFCQQSSQPQVHRQKSAEDILAEAEAIKGQIEGGQCKIVNGHDLTDGNEVAALYRRTK